MGVNKMPAISRFETDAVAFNPPDRPPRGPEMPTPGRQEV